MSRKREHPQDEGSNSSKRPTPGVLSDITNRTNASQARKPATRYQTRTQEERGTQQMNGTHQMQNNHYLFQGAVSLGSIHTGPAQLFPPVQQANHAVQPQSHISPFQTPVLPLHQIKGFAPYIPDPEDAITMYPHEDIDLIAGSEDPSWLTPYIQEIYAHLRQREQQSSDSLFYLTAQAPAPTSAHPELTPEMRKVLINWLHEVSTEFKLKGETLFLSVSYLDRYLSRTVNVPRTKFQLVGVTCLFIAVKYEQIYPIPIEQLIKLTADTYTREEMIVMESEILNALNFELTIPTVKAFLSRFIKASRFDPRRTMLVNFLAELSLLKYELIRFPPSVIAASCVYLTLVSSGRQWTSTLAFYSQISPQNSRHSQAFVQCVQQLYHFWYSERFQEVNSVFEKYSLPQFHSVALTEPAIQH